MLDQLVFMVAHNLLDQSSHPVAYNGVADFLADGYADAELLYLFFAEPIHDELVIGK